MTSTTRKIVVTGPFGAGKSTFVATVAAGAPGPHATTETGVSDGTAALKTSTTVALDHVALVLDPPPASTWPATTVTLFGTPGQDRFGFMREVLLQGADAYAVLVDASRAVSVREAAGIAADFARLAPAAPRLVAVNRWADPAGTRAPLAGLLGVPPQALVACDPRAAADCRTVLHLLLDGVALTEARRAAAAPAAARGDQQ
ncbi:GTP-binding protein [Kineococcus sp. SYSU DK005]|uniref:GTP-binding protein n=1 Tax=Kineococcus sp. SYSU DK005 TaxID=3383126 RepID=UPI003D7DCD71